MLLKRGNNLGGVESLNANSTLYTGNSAWQYRVHVCFLQQMVKTDIIHKCCQHGIV